jgi:hypothetical protein
MSVGGLNSSCNGQMTDCCEGENVEHVGGGGVT